MEKTAPLAWYRLRRLAPVLFTALFLLILVRHLAGTEQFYETLRGASWSRFTEALVAMVGAFVLSARRWTSILEALGHRVPMRRALGAMLATWPLALFTPSRASDVLRAIAIKDLCPPVVGAGSVLAEKAIDVQALCVLTMIGASFSGLWTMASVAFLLSIAEVVVVVALLRRGTALERWPVLRRRPEIIRQLLLTLSQLLYKPGRLAIAALSSVVTWIAATLVVHSLFRAMHADVPFASTLTLWPPAILLGQIPLTLAGMGTRDMAFIYMLRASGQPGISESAVLAATFSYSLVVTWLPALLGLPLTMRFFSRTVPEPRSVEFSLDQGMKHETK